VASPPVVGQTAWESVSTNVVTNTLTTTVVINTNSMIWSGEIPYGSYWWNVGNTGGWLTAHNQGGDYYAFVGQDTSGPTTTNAYSIDLPITNVTSVLLEWGAPSDLNVASRDIYTWSCRQSESDSGDDIAVVQPLDPIMKWDVVNGFKRK